MKQVKEILEGNTYLIEIKQSCVIIEAIKDPPPSSHSLQLFTMYGKIIFSDLEGFEKGETIE